MQGWSGANKNRRWSEPSGVFAVSYLTVHSTQCHLVRLSRACWWGPRPFILTFDERIVLDPLLHRFITVAPSPGLFFMIKRATLILLALTASVAFAQPVPDPDGKTIHAVTAPSLRLNLPFYSSGLVQEWKVKPGDLVSKGTPLITQDARIERKQLEGLKLLADSTKKVEAAKAELEMEIVLLQRKEAQEAEGAFAQEELLIQRAKVAIGQKKVELEEEAQRDAQIKADMQDLKVQLMQLASPIDGRVVSLNVGPGEMADPGKADGAATVVQNNPLHIEFQLPIAQAQSLKVGDAMDVRYTTGEKPSSATVVFVDPEALNDTQTVRLEWQNPENRDSGLPVIVELPERIVAASAK